MYTVIKRCQDEAYIEFVPDCDMQKMLDAGEFDGFKFVDTVPMSLEDFPGNTALIIKGGPVVPVAVKKVTQWRMP